MCALDGNAIGGALSAVFGGEMTASLGTCAHCGATSPMANACVYLRAPGIVARCRSCDGILLVLVEIRGLTCVDLRGLAALGLPA
jgi:Family of unknown function (DUF6510)